MSKTLPKGTRIRITHPSGIYTGTVLTAIDYGYNGTRLDGWYIELTADKGSPCGQGYTYWKQGMDGGTMEILE